MASKDSNDDELKDKPDNSEDNFGLPDIEFKPLNTPAESKVREEATSSAQTGGYSYGASERASNESSASDSSYSVDEPKSKAPIILGIVIILVIAIGGYLIYGFVIKPRNEAAEKARKEQLVKDAEKVKRAEEARLAKQREEEERKKQALADAKPIVGTVETLTAQTRRYYVVVTSNIDDDLLLDFAKRLSVKGISSKIIPPYGDKKFYRLAVADHDTYAAAQTNADAVKTDYGNNVWVLKY